MAEVELDTSVGAEFDPMGRGVIADQPRCRWAAVGGRTRHEHRSIREEDQTSVRTQQTVRLRKPAAGIAPDTRSIFGDRGIEAPPIEGNLFHVGEHEWKVDAMLVLKFFCLPQLRGAEVHTNRVHAISLEPRRDRRCAASEFHDVVTRLESLEKPKTRLWCVPVPPPQLVRTPRSRTDHGRLRCPTVPRFSVPLEVVGDITQRAGQALDHRDGVVFDLRVLPESESSHRTRHGTAFERGCRHTWTGHLKCPVARSVFEIGITGGICVARSDRAVPRHLRGSP